MKTKPTLTKYKLETQLIDELNERKPEMNGKEYFQDVINEIVGNNVPIYTSDLLDLVSEDLNFGFQGEFKISCDASNVDIFMIITNTVYEFLEKIAYKWAEENIYMPREQANAI